MKEYKATYGTALIYTLVHVYLSCTPMMILAGIDMSIKGQTTFGRFLCGYTLICCLALAVYTVFALFIGFIIGLFNKNTVTLSDYSVSYQGKIIPLDKIRYLTLHLPEVSKRHSTPLILTIWADKTTYMHIKRPSIALVVALKNNCHFAAFELDDWKSDLKQLLWIQLAMTATAIIAVIFGFE